MTGWRNNKMVKIKHCLKLQKYRKFWWVAYVPIWHILDDDWFSLVFSVLKEILRIRFRLLFSDKMQFMLLNHLLLLSSGSLLISVPFQKVNDHDPQNLLTFLALSKTCLFSTSPNPSYTNNIYKLVWLTEDSWNPLISSVSLTINMSPGCQILQHLFSYYAP